MQAQNIPSQNDPTQILQPNDDPPLLAVRSSSLMEVTSTSIRPPDNRPPLPNNEDDSWALPPNITDSTIKDPDLANTSRSILTIPGSEYRAVLKFTTRILQSKILKGKPFLTDEEIYMVYYPSIYIMETSRLIFMMFRG
jgi:hypothetical protein